MTKTAIARMVWPEVQEALERKAVVLVPLANIEPSGHHSVMGGEQFIAEHFCEGVAARTGAVWLPAIPVGYAPNWMGYPGATSVRFAAMSALIEDVCKGLLRHGFEHIMIVNNHAGNEPVVDEAARNVRLATGVLVANVPLPVVMRASATDLYADLEAAGGHGGEPGVSVRRYLCPADMRLDLAVPRETRRFQGLAVADTTKVTQGGAHWLLYLDYHELNPSGGVGDPFNASTEKGRIVLERMVDWGVQAVESFRGILTRVQDPGEAQ